VDKRINLFILASLGFFALTLLNKFSQLTIAFSVFFILLWYLNKEFTNPYSAGGVKGNSLMQLVYAAIGIIAFFFISTFLTKIMMGTSLALIQVFVFFLITGIMIILTREAEGAIYMHIGANLSAVLSQYGILGSSLSFQATIPVAILSTLTAGNFTSLLLFIWGWAIVIPYLETALYATALGVMTKGRRDSSAYISAVILAVIYMLFHIFSKSV